MISTCRNLMNTCRFLKDMIDEEKAPIKYDSEEEFKVSGTIKSSPFLLSLFTRVSDHGILYSSTANYRLATAENITASEPAKTSMYMNAYKGKEMIFSTNAMQVMFFQEKEIWEDEANPIDTECIMTSMARESIKIGGTIIKDLIVKFKKVGVFPSMEQLLKVAYILNVKVGKGTGRAELDFAALFDEKLRSFKPSTAGVIVDWVYGVLGWQFFGLTRNVHEDLWRIRSFFQALHPIGVAFIEGNHRAVLASKMLYGQFIEQPYPLTLSIGRTFAPIGLSSPLFCTAMDVKVTVPKKKMNAKRVITKHILHLCKTRSQHVAADKQLVIKESWKSYLQRTVDLFTRTSAYCPLTIQDFLAIKLPTNIRGWEDWDNMTGEIKDRDKITYVDITHRTIEILAKSFVSYHPALGLVQENNITKAGLISMWKRDDLRMGFKFPLHPFYAKEQPEVMATYSYNKNNPFKHFPASIYPELFLRVAPFKGGLNLLSRFVKCDARYMEPLFIAAFILAPVTSIVKHIMTIIQEQKMYDETIKCQKTRKRYHVKVEILLKFWYTQRYLKALIKYGPPSLIPRNLKYRALKNKHLHKEDRPAFETKEQWIDASTLSQHFEEMVRKELSPKPSTPEIIRYHLNLGKLPLILCNLPKEYERWSDKYGQNAGGISPLNPSSKMYKRPLKYWLAQAFDIPDPESDEEKDDSVDEDGDDDDSTYIPEPDEPDDPFSLNPLKISLCTNDDDDDAHLPEGHDGEKPTGFWEFIPFDCSKPLHRSITKVATGEEMNGKFRNHPDWDPFYIAQAMMNGVYEHGLDKFYTGNGKKKERKRKSKATDTDDSPSKKKKKSKSETETQDEAENERPSVNNPNADTGVAVGAPNAMGKQDGLPQDHQEDTSGDKTTGMEDVQDSINGMHDKQDDDNEKINKKSAAQPMHVSNDAANRNLESKTNNKSDNDECEEEEEFDLIQIESTDFNDSDEDHESDEHEKRPPCASIGNTTWHAAGISTTDTVVPTENTLTQQVTTVLPAKIDNPSATMSDKNDKDSSASTAESAAAAASRPTLEPHTHIPELMAEFKRLVASGVIKRSNLKRGDEPPDWLENLNYDTIHEYHQLGKTEHFMSALLLTIKTNFQFAYDNKDEWWAKKILEGLNKVYNLKQIMKKRDQNKQQDEPYHLSMEMLNNNTPVTTMMTKVKTRKIEKDENGTRYIVRGYEPWMKGKVIPDEYVVRPRNHKWSGKYGSECFEPWSSAGCPTYGTCTNCYASGPVELSCDNPKCQKYTYKVLFTRGMHPDEFMITLDSQWISTLVGAKHTQAMADRVQAWPTTPSNQLTRFHMEMVIARNASHLNTDEEKKEYAKTKMKEFNDGLAEDYPERQNNIHEV